MKNPPMTPADFTDEVRQQPKLVENPTDFFNGVFTEPYRFIRIAYRHSEDAVNSEGTSGVVVSDGTGNTFTPPTYETFQAVQIVPFEAIQNFREPELLSDLGWYTLFTEAINEALLAWDVRGDDTEQSIDTQLTSNPYYWDFVVQRKDPGLVRWDDMTFVDIDTDGTGLMKIENPIITNPNYPAGNLEFARRDTTLIAGSTGGNAIFKILAGAITTELNFDGTIYQGGQTDDTGRRDHVVITNSNDMYVAPLNPDGTAPPTTPEIPITPADKMPRFTDGASISSIMARVGTAITDVVLPEATGGDGALTYSLTPNLPNGLVFTAATRTLSGNPSAAIGQTTYTYKATDADGDEATLQFTITVVAADAIPDPICKAGFAYNARTGLCENTLFGTTETPTCPEGWVWNAVTKACERKTAPPTPEIPITPADKMPAFADGASISDISGTVGTKIDDVTLPEATGGDGVLTYSLAPSLRGSGLAFNPDTRVISGTPTTVLATEMTYTVTDADGDTAELKFSFDIQTPSPFFRGFFTFEGTDLGLDIVLKVGEDVNTTFSTAAVFGPTPRIRLNPSRITVSPSLPSGLQISNVNAQGGGGIFSGTPISAQAKTRYTYTFTDRTGTASTDDIYITINA